MEATFLMEFQNCGSSSICFLPKNPWSQPSSRNSRAVHPSHFPPKSPRSQLFSWNFGAVGTHPSHFPSSWNCRAAGAHPSLNPPEKEFLGDKNELRCLTGRYRTLFSLFHPFFSLHLGRVEGLIPSPAAPGAPPGGWNAPGWILG